MAFAFLNRFFGRDELRDSWRPLYARIVAEARSPHWYSQGKVPDTIDGRFEMVCLIAALVMLRMEALGEDGAEGSARLTEVLVEDLEGQVREIGFGEQVIGKRMGELMSAFGGRLGAYRDGLTANDLKQGLSRNLYRGEVPGEAELAHADQSALAFWVGLGSLSMADLKAGELGQ